MFFYPWLTGKEKSAKCCGFGRFIFLFIETHTFITTHLYSILCFFYILLKLVIHWIHKIGSVRNRILSKNGRTQPNLDPWSSRSLIEFYYLLVIWDFWFRDYSYKVFIKISDNKPTARLQTSILNKELQGQYKIPV